jgi:ATP-dependent Clp protease protease subunit
MAKKNKKVKEEEVEVKTILIPDTITQVPPQEPMPRDMTFEKPPGTVLKENGIIFMDKEFNQENCMPLVKMIMEYNLMPAPKAPPIIHLYINSPGGQVASAFHLIDVIKQSKIPVYTYGMGSIASCGVLLMMSGEKGHRYLTQNTSIMSHQYSWGSGGKEHELYAKIKQFEISSEKLIEHYKKCTGKKKDYIRKHLLPESDMWMTPEEAIEHGIADKVIETY